MTTFLGLLAIFALIAGNAWFVAAEFGYVAVRRHGLEEAAAEGDAAAGRAILSQWLASRGPDNPEL